MNQFERIRGCLSEADARWIREECEHLLGEDEVVDCVSRLDDDIILFTEWRLLIVDKDRLRGKKVEYVSLPYHAIVRFSVEAVGTLDLDAEMRIWTAGAMDPIRMQFARAVNVYGFQAKLAQMVAHSHRHA